MTPALPTNFNWDATAFFRDLTANNRLANTEGFRFCTVSGLEGFDGALSQYKAAKALVCVSDISQGAMETDNTPHTRRVKTVFLAYRHKIDDMEARQRAYDKLRDLFRQFMSLLVQERVRLQEKSIYLDSRISFTEIDRYFFSGMACAYFNLAVTTYTDLRYNPDEWLTRIP